MLVPCNLNEWYRGVLFWICYPEPTEGKVAVNSYREAKRRVLNREDYRPQKVEDEYLYPEPLAAVPEAIVNKVESAEKTIDQGALNAAEQCNRDNFQAFFGSTPEEWLSDPKIPESMSEGDMDSIKYVAQRVIERFPILLEPPKEDKKEEKKEEQKPSNVIPINTKKKKNGRR